jgi:tetratricopeptide (TPR) repeat protein
MALLAHGRKREAAAALARAADLPATAGLELARGVYERLAGTAAEPDLRLTPPREDPAISARANQRIQQAFTEVSDRLARGQPERARAALEALPSSLVRHAGPQMRYLRAYVLQSCGAHDLAVGELEALARTEPAFVLDRPELYFFLGRSHDALFHFDKAVRAIRAYVETAQRARARSREALPEPPLPEAPVSDAPGESEKVWRHGLIEG